MKEEAVFEKVKIGQRENQYPLSAECLHRVCLEKNLESVVFTRESEVIHLSTPSLIINSLYIKKEKRTV